MSIELRRDNLYYYRKRRVGSRVISEYVGGGPLAILSAYRDRREREQQQLQLQQQREREIAASLSLADLDAQIDHFSHLVDLLVKAFYLTHGYHQHKRQWRKRRNVTKE